MSGPSHLLNAAEAASLIGFDPNTNSTIAASPAAWEAFSSRYRNLRKADFLMSAASTIANHLSDMQGNYLHNPLLSIVLVMLSDCLEGHGRTIYVCSTEEFEGAEREATRTLSRCLLDVHRTMATRLPVHADSTALVYN